MIRKWKLGTVWRVRGDRLKRLPSLTAHLAPIFAGRGFLFAGRHCVSGPFFDPVGQLSGCPIAKRLPAAGSLFE